MERALPSGYPVLALAPCYVKCGLRIHSGDISRELLRNAVSLAQLPYPQNEDCVCSFQLHKSKDEIKDLRAHGFLGRKGNNFKPESCDKVLLLAAENWLLYAPRILCLK